MSQHTPSTRDASPSDRQSLLTLAILSLLMAFASISTDLYLPALRAMAGADVENACSRGDLPLIYRGPF